LGSPFTISARAPSAAFNASAKSDVFGLRAHDDEHFGSGSDLCGELFCRRGVLRMLFGPGDDAEEGAEQHQRDEHAGPGEVMADEGKEAAHAVKRIMRSGRTSFKTGDDHD
jgi:hypothetical protein